MRMLWVVILVWGFVLVECRCVKVVTENASTNITDIFQN